MATLRERVPEPLEMPVGIAGVAVGIVGIGIGYILTLMGLVLVFGLHGIAEDLTTVESLSVTAIGLVVVAIGLAGWRAFMYFAY